jgi:hypothetical protein
MFLGIYIVTYVPIYPNSQKLATYVSFQGST